MPSSNVFITFCEPNHVRSTTIAEFWNTISSFCYCIPAIYFWILTNRYRNALPESMTTGAVWRYKLCASCWIMLGLGSAAFHAFQNLWTEMWDEIGMMFSILSLSYCLVDLHPWTTSRRANWFYGSLFLAVFAALMVYVQIMYHPFFAATFLITSLVPLVLSWTMPINMNRLTVKLYEEIVQRRSRAARAAKDSALKVSYSVSPLGRLDPNISVLIGIMICLLGYAIWHIDQRCVAAGWKPTDVNFYEFDWYYWAHPFWHLATAAGSLFFFDSMLKVRVETHQSPLLRRPETGSFVPLYSFTNSVKVLLGVRTHVHSS